MKIDLDELERKAKAVARETGMLAQWDIGLESTEVIDGISGTTICNVVADELVPIGRADRTPYAQHIAANSPPVTLALIARIRELEGALGTAADLLQDQRTSCRSESFLAILEKGAVLP